MFTYEDYLKEPRSLTFSEMQEIHAMMVSDIGTDPDALEIYQGLLQKATEYADIRAKWPFLSRGEKMDQDSSRTSCHDSLIIRFNMLSRYVRMQEKPATWRDILGEGSEDPYDRKRIGDFACFLVFINAINSR